MFAYHRYIINLHLCIFCAVLNSFIETIHNKSCKICCAVCSTCSPKGQLSALKIQTNLEGAKATKGSQSPLTPV